jgi:hypothetical protein
MLIAAGVIYLALAAQSLVFIALHLIAGHGLALSVLVDVTITILVGVGALTRWKFVMAKAGIVVFAAVVLLFALSHLSEDASVANIADATIAFAGMVCSALGWQKWNKEEKARASVAARPV